GVEREIDHVAEHLVLVAGALQRRAGHSLSLAPLAELVLVRGLAQQCLDVVGEREEALAVGHDAFALGFGHALLVRPPLPEEFRNLVSPLAPISGQVEEGAAVGLDAGHAAARGRLGPLEDASPIGGVLEEALLGPLEFVPQARVELRAAALAGRRELDAV